MKLTSLKNINYLLFITDMNYLLFIIDMDCLFSGMGTEFLHVI